MSRRIGGVTAANDDDDEGVIDSEVRKLQRTYRNVALNRKAYGDEKTELIRKQQATIAALESDHARLAEELSVLEGSNQSTDLARHRLLGLKVQNEGHKAHIDAEIEYHKELAKHIKDVEKMIKKQREIMGGSLAQQEDTIRVQKLISTLENRLKQANSRFSNRLADNKKLRQIIDHMKKERDVFDNLYRKLEKKDDVVKQDMAECVETANRAFESRDEAQSKMQLLKEKAEKEIASYNDDMKEMTRKLEHERKLKNFMAMKGTDRGNKGDPALAESRLKKTAQKDGTPQEILGQYEKAFEKIKEATSIQDTEKLVDKFIETEETNFSLFNYVNELDNEIETLQEKIHETKNEIESFKKEGQDIDSKRSTNISGLEEKLKVLSTQADGFQEQYQQNQQDLDQLRPKVKDLFEKLNCDKSIITDMLGNADVTDRNMLQFLGVIEQRANELLQQLAILQAKAADKWERETEERKDAITQAKIAQDEEKLKELESKPLGPKPEITGLLGAGPQPAPGPIIIAPPSTIDDEEDDENDDESRPLTHAELKERIMRGMKR